MFVFVRVLQPDVKGKPMSLLLGFLRKGCHLPDSDWGKDKGFAAGFHLLSLLLSSQTLVALYLLPMWARHLTVREEGGEARRASNAPGELASVPQAGCSTQHAPSLLLCRWDGS